MLSFAQCLDNFPLHYQILEMETAVGKVSSHKAAVSARMLGTLCTLSFFLHVPASSWKAFQAARVANKVLLVISQESLAKKRTASFSPSDSFKHFFFLFPLLLCIFRKEQAFVQALHKINTKYSLFPKVINAHSEQISCSQPEMNGSYYQNLNF